MTDSRPQAPSPLPQSPLLEMSGITRSFPGVLALDAVDFTLRRGEIHALIGENGAGKSTLIKVLTGVYRPDAGQILLDGKTIHPRNPLDAQRIGISTVYQEVNLIPDLSVAENMFLGREPRGVAGIRWRQINRRAAEALAKFDLRLDVTRPLNTCSIAVQQMVAIARAVDVEAKVLVLDEPTSSLDAAEVEQLFRVMRRLKDRGLGIVFVSHFLEQVYAISGRMTVLRNGKLVGAYETCSLPRLELISKMIGKDVNAVAEMTGHHAAASSAPEETGTALLETRGLSRRGAVERVDLRIGAGEVLGLAGLLGSGRTETARLLFGIDPPDHGQIRIAGRRVRMTSPRMAIRRGLGFVPEDRKVQSIIPSLSVRENIVLALQARRGWLLKLPRRRASALAEGYIRALNIATPDADKPIGQLSGGNQQKAILARWLALQPRLLILDEPTRGIDVGAKAEIERLIDELCRDGMAILFISSELEEVARVSHRVTVLRDRRQIAELRGAEVDVQHIIRTIAATR